MQKIIHTLQVRDYVVYEHDSTTLLAVSYEVDTLKEMAIKIASDELFDEEWKEITNGWMLEVVMGSDGTNIYESETYYVTTQVVV